MPTLFICSYSTGGYLIIVEKKNFSFRAYFDGPKLHRFDFRWMSHQLGSVVCLLHMWRPCSFNSDSLTHAHTELWLINLQLNKLCLKKSFLNLENLLTNINWYEVPGNGSTVWTHRTNKGLSTELNEASYKCQYLMGMQCTFFQRWLQSQCSLSQVSFIATRGKNIFLVLMARLYRYTK